LDLQNRTFIKVSSSRPRDRIVVLDHGGEGMATPQPDEQVRLREVAFDSTPAAQVVVGRNGNLVLANEEARALFGLSPQDLGRPFQDLEISYRPLELRSMIEQVYAERRTIILTDVERHLPDGQVQYLDVQVKLLQDNGSELLGAGISFRDVTRHSHLQEELQHSKKELKTAYEELQATNEELETTNEELQSAVEELQTTNEELQSTTEEVETTNEELQATNEELQAINERFRESGIELNRLNAFLTSILGSVRVGIVVVDHDLKVLLWNSWAENLWGLRAREAQGQSLLELDIGLPIEQLRAPAQASLAGETDHREILVDAANRRGKAIRCHITFTPCLDAGGGPHGLVLLMEEER
jgi:two-component system CheB/CheR fusion protein